MTAKAKKIMKINVNWTPEKENWKQKFTKKEQKNKTIYDFRKTFVWEYC